jgi:hypothetical protein
LANASIAASRVGWNLGAAASERQYLARIIHGGVGFWEVSGD